MVNNGNILGPFWNYFGTIWDYFWTIFGPFCDHLETISGPFWDYFGTILGPLLFGPIWHILVNSYRWIPIWIFAILSLSLRTFLNYKQQFSTMKKVYILKTYFMWYSSWIFFKASISSPSSLKKVKISMKLEYRFLVK